jgi:hypothetical protein
VKGSISLFFLVFEESKLDGRLAGREYTAMLLLEDVLTVYQQTYAQAPNDQSGRLTGRNMKQSS